MKKVFTVILAILIVLIASAFVLHSLIFVPQTDLDFDRYVIVEIPPGSNTANIAQLLHDNGLIRHPRLFRITARLNDTASLLRAGRHVVRRPMSIYELTNALARTGGSFDIKVTIPEGWTIYQIAGILEDEMGIDTTEFYEVVFSKRLLDSLNLKAPSFEGFLYPETYHFPETFSAYDVVMRMHSEFRKMWATKTEMAAKYGRPMEDIVTLASIIEAEATTSAEREIISSVFNNRLRINMKLQADPTTIYGQRIFHRPLLLRDLRVDCVYNTYYHYGLPPGPICNPPEASIDAAMNPAETPYFYFVSREDGTHQFSVTLQEHHRAIRTIRNR